MSLPPACGEGNTGAEVGLREAGKPPHHFTRYQKQHREGAPD
jgi:hypothetical protein